MAKNNKVFIKITNKDIWDKLEAHTHILNRIEQHLIRLNSQVSKNKSDIKLNRKILWWLVGSFGTALAFILSLIFAR